VVFKLFNPCQLYYDILENYALNIANNQGYSRWFRTVLSAYVRVKETILAGRIDHFFLAERVYERDLGFVRGRSTTLLNKYVRKEITIRTPIPWQIIYSGTIEARFGIFESIELCKSLHKLQPQISLLIIGYAAHAPTLEKVKDMIRDDDFIELIGGDRPVPHHQILEKIAESSFALVPHRLDPSIRDNFPSKIYEYLAFRKPIIVRDHTPWVEYINRYQAGIPVNFEESPEVILNRLNNERFYPDGVDEDIYWESEGRKLVEIITN
jgi:glycosyltransferase involved in cell wall biosynthesis